MPNETLFVVVRRLKIRTDPSLEANPPVDIVTQGMPIVVDSIPIHEAPGRVWRKIVEGKENHIGKFISEEFDGKQLLSPTLPQRDPRRRDRTRRHTPGTKIQALFPADLRGLHGEAGGQPPKSDEIEAFRANNIKIAFINADQEGVADNIVDNLKNAGVQHFVIRATVTPPEVLPDDTPEEEQRKRDTTRLLLNEFVSRTSPKLRQFRSALQRAFPGSANFYVQVHNEPNLDKEGWRSRWKDGREFADWFNGVVAEYRADPALGGIKIGFSPMSPGDGHATRMQERVFIRGATSAIRNSDWIAVHAYWTIKEDGSLELLLPKNAWREDFMNKPMLATEVGPRDGIIVKETDVRVVYDVFKAAGLPACMWLSHDNWEDLPDGNKPEAPPWLLSSWTKHRIRL